MSEKPIKLPMILFEPDLLKFLDKFKFVERIDPQVHCFTGEYIYPELEKLLFSKTSDYVGVSVYLYVIDNADIGCGTTFRVEIGLKQRDNYLCKMFAKSSPFCSSIETAYTEAAMNILYKNLDRIYPRQASYCVRET